MTTEELATNIGPETDLHDLDEAVISASSLREAKEQDEPTLMAQSNESSNPKTISLEQVAAVGHLGLEDVVVQEDKDHERLKAEEATKLDVIEAKIKANGNFDYTNSSREFDKLLRHIPGGWRRSTKVINDQEFQYIICPINSNAPKIVCSIDISERQVIRYQKSTIAIIVRELMSQDLLQVISTEKLLRGYRTARVRQNEIDRIRNYRRPGDMERAVVSRLGQPVSDIAAELFLSEESVNKYIRSAARKLGVKGREKFVIKLAQQGKIPLEGVPTGLKRILTAKEKELLQHYYKYTAEQAALMLGVSTSTVEKRWHRMYKKTGATNRIQLLLMALRDELELAD